MKDTHTLKYQILCFVCSVPDVTGLCVRRGPRAERRRADCPGSLSRCRPRGKAVTRLLTEDPRTRDDEADLGVLRFIFGVGRQRPALEIRREGENYCVCFIYEGGEEVGREERESIFLLRISRLDQ